MEPVGFWGIIKLTIQIILRNLNHFLRIAFLLALPYALNFIVLSPSSIQTLVASIPFLHKLLSAPPPQGPSSPFSDHLETHYSLYLLILLSIFDFIISLLCILLITLTVCSACMNRSLDLKGSDDLHGMRICRSVISLLLTALAVNAVIIAFYAVIAVVMLKVIPEVDKSLLLPITVMIIGVEVGGGLYIAVELSLANTVAIVEEKKGWKAMRRSMYLIRGHKGVALGVVCFYGLLSLMPLYFVHVSADASGVWRWAAGGVSVGLQTVIALCMFVSKVVLYMSCKGQHELLLEPLHTAILPSSHDQFLVPTPAINAAQPSLYHTIFLHTPPPLYHG